jgi:Ca2+-binding EF-hand superfamily protein
MKRLAFCFTAVVVAVSVANIAIAQPSEGRSGQGEDQPLRGPEAGPRGPGEPEFRPPPNPLLEAFDANGDGEISADEIKSAAAALAKLDKNGDGKLTGEEIRPQVEEGREGGPRPGPGREAGRIARRDSNPFSSEVFIALIMELDKNKDGVVSKDEIPERLQRILYRADFNLDGAVDKQELEHAAQRLREIEQSGGEAR